MSSINFKRSLELYPCTLRRYNPSALFLLQPLLRLPRRMQRFRFIPSIASIRLSCPSIPDICMSVTWPFVRSVCLRGICPALNLVRHGVAPCRRIRATTSCAARSETGKGNILQAAGVDGRACGVVCGCCRGVPMIGTAGTNVTMTTASYYFMTPPSSSPSR